MCVGGHGGSAASDGGNQFDLVVGGQAVLRVLRARHKLQVHGRCKGRLNADLRHGIGQGGAWGQGVGHLVDVHVQGRVRHVQTSN